MKRAIALLLIFCTVFFVTACAKDDAPKPDPNDPFYGDWILDEGGFQTFYEFDGLGKVTITIFDISDICAYAYDEESITIKTRREETILVDTYKYSFGESTLTLTNEKETLTLTKIIVR